MSDFGFNVPEKSSLSFEAESKKVFEQTQGDLVFQKGKTVKSKVMSSPMFINTIQQYGADAAKTIILQELLQMNEDEIEQEISILSVTAEDDNEIKRALRAAKFLAIQWLEDPKRGEEVQNKCDFIIQKIPTFKIAPNKSTTEPIKPKVTSSIETKIEEKPKELEVPAIQGKPTPPNNPPEVIVTKVNEINKLVSGEKLLLITDVQGDFNRLREYLLKYKVVNPDLTWNKNIKHKLVLVGDLYNKSPYSSWGGKISYQSFQVFELLRKLSNESGGNVFVCLSSFDAKLCSGQIFNDTSFGFCSSTFGIKAQAQILPGLLSFIESTAFDTEENIYSCWKRENINGELYFKLKSDFQIGEKPDITIKANDMYLPDITSLRNFLQTVYSDISQTKDKRSKTPIELDRKLQSQLKVKDGENLEALLTSRGRSYLAEGIFRGTGTLSFLRKIVFSTHKFQTDKRENLTFSHVSLQQEYGQFFDKAKENNWKVEPFEKILQESKFLKLKKIDPAKLLRDLKQAGYNTTNQFLTADPEEMFENLTKKNMLDLFVPTVSPNKVKFGFVKSLERLQEGLKQEDKTGLLGFRLVDRKLEDNFEDTEMKKVSELNDSSKQAYAEKFLSDIFGNTKGFVIKHTPDKTVLCEKPFWKISIEIDKTAALYQDENKAIHVPIKHVAYLAYG